MNQDAEIMKYLRTGPHTAIVKILRRYNKPLSIDFLAHLMGRSRREVREYVDGLKKSGIVEIEEMVVLK